MGIAPQFLFSIFYVVNEPMKTTPTFQKTELLYENDADVPKDGAALSLLILFSAPPWRRVWEFQRDYYAKDSSSSKEIRQR